MAEFASMRLGPLQRLMGACRTSHFSTPFVSRDAKCTSNTWTKNHNLLNLLIQQDIKCETRLKFFQVFERKFTSLSFHYARGAAMQQ